MSNRQHSPALILDSDGDDGWRRHPAALTPPPCPAPPSSTPGPVLFPAPLHHPRHPARLDRSSLHPPIYILYIGGLPVTVRHCPAFGFVPIYQREQAGSASNIAVPTVQRPGPPCPPVLAGQAKTTPEADSDGQRPGPFSSSSARPPVFAGQAKTKPGAGKDRSAFEISCPSLGLCLTSGFNNGGWGLGFGPIPDCFPSATHTRCSVQSTNTAADTPICCVFAVVGFRFSNVDLIAPKA